MFLFRKCFGRKYDYNSIEEANAKLDKLLNNEGTILPPEQKQDLQLDPLAAGSDQKMSEYSPTAQLLLSLDEDRFLLIKMATYPSFAKDISGSDIIDIYKYYVDSRSKWDNRVTLSALVINLEAIKRLDERVKAPPVLQTFTFGQKISLLSYVQELEIITVQSVW